LSTQWNIFSLIFFYFQNKANSDFLFHAKNKTWVILQFFKFFSDWKYDLKWH
jgi:hypothetical protein